MLAVVREHLALQVPRVLLAQVVQQVPGQRVQQVRAVDHKVQQVQQAQVADRLDQQVRQVRLAQPVILDLQVQLVMQASQVPQDQLVILVQLAQV